ncbi:hypothetical protein [Telluribacter sp.]|uniref:hypothetical protein n=1 Tax=Telluribacter sp. TaxID=1978767 RepID=UPI002E12CEC0|nr:hypothetical protein [Telluribacter sp.]
MKNTERVNIARFADLAAGVSRFREAPRTMLLTKASCFLEIEPTVFPETLRPQWEVIMAQVTEREAAFCAFGDAELDKIVHTIFSLSEAQCRFVVRQILALHGQLLERNAVPTFISIRRQRMTALTPEWE